MIIVIPKIPPFDLGDDLEDSMPIPYEGLPFDDLHEEIDKGCSVSLATIFKPNENPDWFCSGVQPMKVRNSQALSMLSYVFRLPIYPNSSTILMQEIPGAFPSCRRGPKEMKASCSNVNTYPMLQSQHLMGSVMVTELVVPLTCKKDERTDTRDILGRNGVKCNLEWLSMRSPFAKTVRLGRLAMPSSGSINHILGPVNFALSSRVY